MTQEIVMSRRMERVRAVVVTYGARFEFASGAVRSALDAGATDCLLVVNGGPAEVYHRFLELREQHGDRLRLEKLARNTGSAGGFAAAIEYARASDGCDWLWLLDDDNWPTSESLREAGATLDRWGAVTPVAIACFRSSDQYQARIARGEPPRAVYPRPGSVLSFDIRARIRSRAFYPRSTPGRDSEVLSAPYGGLLIPIEVARAAALPCADFVLYEDDTEYTERLRRRGVRLILSMRATVIDADGRRLPEDSPRGIVKLLRTKSPAEQLRMYYGIRNGLVVDRIRARQTVDRLFLLVNVAIFVGAIVGFASRDARNRVALPALVHAFRDGWLGRLGPTRALADA